MSLGARSNKDLGIAMAGAAEDLYLGPQPSKINTYSIAGIPSVKYMIYRLIQALEVDIGCQEKI
jgi:hypothetical protein